MQTQVSNLEEVFGIYAKLKRVQKLQQEGREFETPITPKDLRANQGY